MPAQESAADLLITNVRHKQLVDGALASLWQARGTFEKGEPLEVTALFLREALNSLGEIIGVVTTDDILNKIFSEFCIGK
jgi:tRNA modification GTPase